MSLAYVAVAASVIATGISTYSAIQQGQAAKNAADYNAAVQRKAAAMETQRGATEAAEHRQKVKQMISRQNAAFGASGVEGSTGSAADVMTETAGMGELDALRIVNNSQRQAWGLESQARIGEYEGKAAYQQGIMKGTTSLLSGASNTYFQGKQAGLWGKDKKTLLTGDSGGYFGPGGKK